MDDYDEIKKLAKEASENIDKRKELLQAENERYTESKDEFMKTENLIKKLSDEEAEGKAEKMYDTMMERYEAYDELYDSYMTILKKEKDLYSLFIEEDTEQEDLTDHLNSLNEDYESVIETNEKFNEETEKYNKLKKDFYSSTELDVDYQNDKANKAEKE